MARKALLFVAASAAVAAASSALAAPRCDRACLTGLADAYVASLSSGTLPAKTLAKSFRATENLAPAKPGADAWGAVDHVEQKQIIVDAQAGQVLVTGLLRLRDGKAVVHAARLAVADKALTQAEIISRPVDESVAARLALPLTPFDTEVAPGRRASRAALVEASGRYFQALEAGDARLARFASGCKRFDTVFQTACGVAMPIKSRDVRPLLVDEARGLVASTAFLDIRLGPPPGPAAAGQPGAAPPGAGGQVHLYMAALFKIEDDQIQGIKEISISQVPADAVSPFAQP